MRPVSISLQPETLEKLKALAEVTGQTVTQLIRETLEDLVEEKKVCPITS